MKPILSLAIVCASFCTLSAQTIEKTTPHFKRVIASPRINLVLIAGNSESVKINYANVDPSKINVVVKHNTLHIYLDGSKYLEKRNRVKKDGWVEKESAYRDASITAYVTYHHLEKLVVRGEQQVDIQGDIDSKKFKLSAYGECDITLASLQADKFKASLYGQHVVRIKSGVVGTQKYKLFGENKIDAQAIQSEDIASSTYGESRLRFNANDNLRLVTFGESDVLVKGNAEVNHFTFGHISMKK
jgi:hypothetical protein